MNGLSDILPQANHLWCTQHLQNADSTKLAKMGANKKTIEHIMADIYGSQVNTLECKGLADAVDLEDFQTKLKNLKSCLG